MTKTTTNLLGILITILAGTYFFITCCSECGMAMKEETPMEEEVTPPPAVTPTATSYPFSFEDGEYSYNANDNFNFNGSSNDILMPLSQKVVDGVTSLKGFLSENEGKVINLTGYYKGDETNSSAFPNLGLARANSVKNYLADNGVSSSQINTMGKLMDDMVAEDNVFLGPIAYSLEAKSENAADELKALYDKIKADPLVLKFNTGEASINLSATQRQKVADISRYLDKVADAKCNVTGHTDSEGSRATNVGLGLDRANFAKSYLMQNGIPEAKIITASKGPDEPIASNATEEGKAKNRRTVVSLN